VIFRRSRRIFTPSGERKFLTVNNVNDSTIALRSAARTGTFRFDLQVGHAQDFGKHSIELKENPCL
jgi:hypothetical protein